MGKLHKLRKVIERDPERWFRKYNSGNKEVYGARKIAGRWHPANLYYGEYRWSYARFVRRVLIDLGYYP
jgi:hypothetical protein